MISDSFFSFSLQDGFQMFSVAYSLSETSIRFVVFFVLHGEMFEGPVATTRAREATGALTPLHREVPCEM